MANNLIPTKIPYFTYARAILATESPSFAEVISVSKKLPYLKQEQIDNAYIDPHKIFLIKIIARLLAKVLNQKIEANNLEHALLEQKKYIEEALIQLQDQVESGKIDSKVLKQTEEKLGVQYKKVEDSLNTLRNIVFPSQEKLKEKINNLITKQNTEWQNHETQSLEKLIKALEEKNLIFENEKTIFLNPESTKSLTVNIIETYQQHGLDSFLPVSAEKLSEKFSNESRLLAWYAIYAALSHNLEGGVL